jgi:hypothetical protein
MVTYVATNAGCTDDRVAFCVVFSYTGHSGILNVRALDPFRLRIREVMHMIRLHYPRIN